MCDRRISHKCDTIIVFRPEVQHSFSIPDLRRARSLSTDAIAAAATTEQVSAGEADLAQRQEAQRVAAADEVRRVAALKAEEAALLRAAAKEAEDEARRIAVAKEASRVAAMRRARCVAKETERAAAVEQARRVAVSVARATAGAAARVADHDAAAADRAEQRAADAIAEAKISAEKAQRAAEAVNAVFVGYTGSTRAARAEHRADHAVRVATSVRLATRASYAHQKKRRAVRAARLARSARDLSASASIKAASAAPVLDAKPLREMTMDEAKGTRYGKTARAQANVSLHICSSFQSTQQFYNYCFFLRKLSYVSLPSMQTTTASWECSSTATSRRSTGPIVV